MVEKMSVEEIATALIRKYELNNVEDILTWLDKEIASLKDPIPQETNGFDIIETKDEYPVDTNLTKGTRMDDAWYYFKKE